MPTASTAAGTEPSFSNTTEHVTTIKEPIEVPVETACLGETLTLNGFIASTETAVLDEEGNLLHLVNVGTVHATGVGAVSGQLYRLQQRFQFQFDTPNLLAPHGLFTDHVSGRLITEGNALDEVADLMFHLVINGQGIEQVTVDYSKGHCVGSGA